MKYNLLYITFITFIFSCKTPKNTVSQKKTGNADSSIKEIKTVEVSFYSICCGTNSKAEDTFFKLLREYPKVKDDSYNWGKEGETNHCLTLTNLSTNEQKALLKKLKQLAETMELVRVTKNVTCVHKNRSN